MTKVYFGRHAEPNFNNHDDRNRELTAKGLADRKLVTAFWRIRESMLCCQVPINEQVIR